MTGECIHMKQQVNFYFIFAANCPHCKKDVVVKVVATAEDLKADEDTIMEFGPEGDANEYVLQNVLVRVENPKHVKFEDEWIMQRDKKRKDHY